jgi:hypothetical protein
VDFCIPRPSLKFSASAIMNLKIYEHEITELLDYRNGTNSSSNNLNTFYVITIVSRQEKHSFGRFIY